MYNVIYIVFWFIMNMKNVNCNDFFLIYGVIKDMLIL